MNFLHRIYLYRRQCAIYSHNELVQVQVNKFTWIENRMWINNKKIINKICLPRKYAQYYVLSMSFPSFSSVSSVFLQQFVAISNSLYAFN